MYCDVEVFNTLIDFLQNMQWWFLSIRFKNNTHMNTLNNGVQEK